MPQSQEFKSLKRKLKRHLDAIATEDSDVAGAITQVGYPEPRIRPCGFETLLSIIVSQQVSTEAAKSIWNKVKATLPELTPKTVTDCATETLRNAGLSGRKVEYAKGLAESILNGSFQPLALPKMTDKEAMEHIVSLRGFGQWSAEIYLMFSLQSQTSLLPMIWHYRLPCKG